MWICLSLVPRVATGVLLLPLVALYVEGITPRAGVPGAVERSLVYCGVCAGWTLRWRFLVPVLFALGIFMVVSGVILG